MSFLDLFLIILWEFHTMNSNNIQSLLQPLQACWIPPLLLPTLMPFVITCWVTCLPYVQCGILHVEHGTLLATTFHDKNWLCHPVISVVNTRSVAPWVLPLSMRLCLYLMWVSFRQWQPLWTQWGQTDLSWTWRQDLMQRPWVAGGRAVLLTGLLLIACSALFLKPGTTSSGIEPPTGAGEGEDCTFSHQSLIQKMTNSPVLWRHFLS